MAELVLKNNNGVQVTIMSFGARIGAVEIPTENGRLVDIVVGYPTEDDYKKGDHYPGAICGRAANRIIDGKFTLEGTEYQLPQNDAPNHLHGGPEGFSKLDWTLEETTVEGAASACKLTLVSEDGDQGYPGKLEVEAVYCLTDANELKLVMSAKTDKTTIVNLTSHPYFNLKGAGRGDILDHTFMVNAKEFTPLGDKGAPDGEIRSVEGTAMDLREAKELAGVVKDSYEQIQRVGGIDHNWVVNKPLNEMGVCGRVEHAATGRSVEVRSTQPGFQAYTGMHFDGTDKGKGGVAFTPYCAIAVEAQGFPDSPNKEHFPSVVLKPEETYEQTIVYAFGF